MEFISLLLGVRGALGNFEKGEYEMVKSDVFYFDTGK